MKLEEYKSKLLELLNNLQARFTDLKKLKSYFSFLVKPFETDVVTSGCPIPEPLVLKHLQLEIEILPKDCALKWPIHLRVQLSFGNNYQKLNICS